MKLSRHAFVRFWDVHAWIGVAGGLVLHVMFLAGGFSVFYEELCDWQEGGRAAPAASGASIPIGALVERALRDRGAQPKQVNLSLTGEHRRVVEVSWRDKLGGDRVELHIDPATGAVTPSTSRLGTILFWLHFLYHPKASWGMYVAGALGVAMLLALITGVLIHLKDLARQFHQFRPRKRTRVLWSDMHKVLGVMGLPFQLMYALTGSLLCLTSVALALFVTPVFDGDSDAATASLYGEPAKLPPTGRAAQALSVDALLARARDAVPGFDPQFVQLDNIGDAAGTASLWGERAGRLFARGDVVLRATDGAVIADTVSAFPTPAAATTRWVTGLHYVWFGGLAAKIVYALLAAATCLTILTGNWIWLARRQLTAGNRLLTRLTTGVGGGVLIAAAALFWANRLAPVAARATCESVAFFGVWGACAVLFLVRAESRRGWVGILRVAGAGFALVPLAGTLARRSTPLPGVEVGLVMLGLALWGAAAIVRKRAAEAPPAAEREPLLVTPGISEGEA